LMIMITNKNIYHNIVCQDPVNEFGRGEQND